MKKAVLHIWSLRSAAAAFLPAVAGGRAGAAAPGEEAGYGDGVDRAGGYPAVAGGPVREMIPAGMMTAEVLPSYVNFGEN